MRLHFFLRVVLTLLLALAAALACVVLRTPLPWMIGPLVATALMSMTGLPTESWVPLRNGGQWVIGTALGLYFTPAVTALVVSLWWAIGLAIAWALMLGLGFAAVLHRLHAPRLPQVEPKAMRATAFYAGAVGGASEMTLLAERAGGRTDLVAAAHSLRLMVVVLVIPFGLQASGLTGVDLTPAGPRVVHPAGLVALAALTGAGAWLMRRLGRANPWFMGALVAARFAAAGVADSRAHEVDALVLSSPAFDTGMSIPQKLLLATLGRAAPGLALHNGLQPAWISRDPRVVRAYAADPLVHDRITPRLARFIVDGAKVVAERAADWPVPTLLLYAGADRCVAAAGSAGFAAAAPQARVAAHEFRALFHEIFNEPEQAEVFGVLHEWLQALVPAWAASCTGR